MGLAKMGPLRSLWQQTLLKATNEFGLIRGVRCTSAHAEKDYSCQLLVVGGGSAGCSIASKFVSKYGKGKVIVLEPAEVHYYQPLFTLVGGGVCTVDDCARSMGSVLPKGAVWVRDQADSFTPTENKVHTKNGSTIKYDILVLALGLHLNFDKVEGLWSALETAGSGVCTNYSPKFASKTFKELKLFSNGNAIFTCPSTPIKCGGAPQKIAYLADSYLRKVGKRNHANFMFKTGAGVFFVSPYYEKALYPVARDRGIDVSLKQDLVAVNHIDKTAVFRHMESSAEESVPYSFLHVTPPQCPPPVLLKSKDLVDAAGWVDVNKDTLQHVRFDNVFSLGDCSNLPTSKTAAAVAAQLGILSSNINSSLEGKPLQAKYDGYTSCPLVTGFNKLIMAEFGYDKLPLETFPFDQRKESWLLYQAKRYALPVVYWNLMLKGHWDGPSKLRHLIK